MPDYLIPGIYQDSNHEPLYRVYLILMEKPAQVWNKDQTLVLELLRSHPYLFLTTHVNSSLKGKRKTFSTATSMAMTNYPSPKLGKTTNVILSNVLLKSLFTLCWLCATRKLPPTKTFCSHINFIFTLRRRSLPVLHRHA